MKPSYYWVSILFFFAACSNADKNKPQQIVTENSTPVEQKDSFKTGDVIPSIQCKHDESFSYALFLPHQYKDSVHLPVLIFADPHGDGSFPLNKYSILADKFGVILMGSNDSKNGIPFTQSTSILQNLIAEAILRFHAADKEISLTGFSGGAKAVLAAASETPAVLSIIYCSAGIPGITGTIPPALGITGLKDMNYTEVFLTDEQLGSVQPVHALIEWKGKHEWSDSATFQNAFYWIRFQAMKNKLDSLDENMIRTFLGENSKVASDPLMEEMRLKKLISFLNGVSNIETYRSSLEMLHKQKSFLLSVAKQKNDFELESHMKENYLQCLELKDPMWWHEQVENLRNSKTNAMNDRILGYISLACYTYSNNALKQGNFTAAEKYLAIYYMVDRENPDRAIMQATLYANQKNKAGVIQSIREAIDYGFKDKIRLLQDPAFEPFRSTAEFNDQLNRLE